MKQLHLLILSSVTLVVALLINYLSNTELIGPQTVGDVSAQYDTLITPAGYAFSIWGLIYVMLILFTGYQWYDWLKSKSSEVIDQTSTWFAMANIANALWVIVWINELLFLSLILIVVLLFSLFKLVINLNLEMWDAPRHIIFFVWWPVTIYCGWVILATGLNLTVFLVSLNIDGETLSIAWAVLLIGVSTLVYLTLTYKRNMREAALVGVWGLVAIAVRQAGVTNSITLTALISAGVLLIYVIYHAFKNRALPR
ncbi:hypothetical protein QA601_11280 [Chitinispirillales bacterium ANBcel5]|uniref:hypothetical protein n=1 Tax=Cellulosispirillum alkaliphilum TaxID=3039283 RepID=UPI002A522240|nr:hypothetical protein [Chitinispirillales bacterium ANBcel5]